PVVAVRGSYSNKGKARLHRPASPLPPTDLAVRRSRKLAGEPQDGHGLMPRRATQQFCWATDSLPAPWRQRRSLVGPHGDLFRDANRVGKAARRYSLSELRDDTVAGICHDRRPRKIIRQQPIDLFEGNLPLGLKANLSRNGASLTPPPIPAPLLRQVQAPCTGHAHRAVGQRHSHSHLAVILFAERPAVLPRHT